MTRPWERAGTPGPLPPGRCPSVSPAIRVRCQITTGHPHTVHRYRNGRFHHTWTTDPTTSKENPRG